MIAVSGVFRSWDTLVISSVFIFLLLTSSCTAFWKPSWIDASSSRMGLNNPISSFIEVFRSPAAICLVASSSLSYSSWILPHLFLIRINNRMEYSTAPTIPPNQIQHSSVTISPLTATSFKIVFVSSLPSWISVAQCQSFMHHVLTFLKQRISSHRSFRVQIGCAR